MTLFVQKLPKKPPRFSRNNRHQMPQKKRTYQTQIILENDSDLVVGARVYQVNSETKKAKRVRTLNFEELQIAVTTFAIYELGKKRSKFIKQTSDGKATTTRAANDSQPADQAAAGNG